MKSLRSLRIPLIVLAALCLLFFLYYQLIFKKQSIVIEPTTEGNGTVLLSLLNEDIQSLSVINVNGKSFTISSNETLNESRQWLFQGSDGLSSELTYSQALLDSYVSSYANISTISKIETEQISFPEYGLEPPDYLVQVILVSGEKYELYIGDYTIEKESIYVKISDSNEVYLASPSLRNLCEYTYIEFLDTQLFSIQYNDVHSFSYMRKTDPLNVILSPSILDITSETTYSQWNFISPLAFMASNEMSALIESVLNLPIYKFLSENSKSEDYGLIEPDYSFSISKIDGTDVNIYLSQLIGDYYYGYTNLSPNIFMVSQDSLTGLQRPLINLISSKLFSEDVSEIRSIEATFPEGSFLLEMDLEGDEHFKSANAKIYVNKRNAIVFDSLGNAYYEVLYNSICNLNLSGIDLDQLPVNTKNVSFKVIKKDGSSIIIDYSEKDSESYYIFIDDLYNGFVVSKSELYGSDGTNYQGYGIWDAYELLNNALDGQMNGKYDISES